MSLFTGITTAAAAQMTKPSPRMSVVQAFKRNTLRERLHQDVHNMRNERREQAALQRRGLQVSSAERMPLKPSRVPSVSPGWLRGPYWRFHDEQKQSARIQVECDWRLAFQNNAQSVKALQMLRAMSNQFNTSVVQLKQATRDMTDFEVVASTLVQLLSTARTCFEHLHFAATCEVSGVKLPDVTSLGWDLDSFLAVHAFLHDAAERGDLSAECLQYLCDLEELAEVAGIKLNVPETYLEKKQMQDSRQKSVGQNTIKRGDGQSEMDMMDDDPDEFSIRPHEPGREHVAMCLKILQSLRDTVYTSKDINTE